MQYRLFIILLPLFIGSSVCCQTKDETQQWILNKLQKNILIKNNSSEIGEYQKKYVSSVVRNYKFYFNNECLVIESDQITNSGGDNDSVHYKLLIPIYDIQKIYKRDENKSNVTRDYDEIAFQTKGLTMLYKNDENKTTSKTLFYSIYLSNLEDENLATRLNKAFENLKTFYKAPTKSKEIF